jgi:hypothetical protein
MMLPFIATSGAVLIARATGIDDSAALMSISASMNGR